MWVTVDQDTMLEHKESIDKILQTSYLHQLKMKSFINWHNKDSRSFIYWISLILDN